MQILFAECVFEGEELFAVGVCCGEGGVVEREEEGVDVRDPAKSRWLNSDAHGDSVGKHGGDVGFIEDVGGVVAALLGADVFAGCFKLSETGGVEREAGR